MRRNARVDELLADEINLPMYCSICQDLPFSYLDALDRHTTYDLGKDTLQEHLHDHNRIGEDSLNDLCFLLYRLSDVFEESS